MGPAHPDARFGWRSRLLNPGSLWGASSSAWGLASFVVVRLAAGRSLSTGEILFWAPVCYALGMITVFLVSRAARRVLGPES